MLVIQANTLAYQKVNALAYQKGLVLHVEGQGNFAKVKGNKDSPEGTKAKLQIEGRAPMELLWVLW
jgi:hypothetical protein